mmetsp:Transcript_114796/g.245034  ORF Transcript_114796/g.245034 Transcript_114796/m.245034 type:complete len:213 (+) Transcript_114796:1367-2005(+)
MTLRFQMSPRAFVPPTPKEETPAMPTLAPQSTMLSTKIAGKPMNSMCGLMRFRCTFGEPMQPVSIIMHFAMPPAPAHASIWPKLDLAVVKTIALLRSFMTSRSALTSIGSPRAVPVPWHSAMVISEGVSPASCIDALMHFCWAGPLGAERLALRPSWFTLLPMRQPSIRWASSSLSPWVTKTPPQPSPLAKPVADSSKVKDLPPLESMPAEQ